MNLTERLDHLMSQRELNKMKLSRACGVPYMTIVNLYERGWENTKLSTLQKISNFFGCTIDYLLGNENQINEVGATREPATLKKKLLIEIDVITGKMEVTNDDMSYIEVMGALEYAKMMYIKDWMGE